MKNKLYIVMPAYNEEVNISETIRNWHAVVKKIGENCRLVIFNDGSKDNTLKIMLDLKKKYKQFIPIDKPNSGHGATCIYAYNYCIDEGVDYIFQTDSDGQTNPEEFWDFWEKRNEYDFVVGYRKKRQDGFSRVLVTRTLKFIIWLIFGEKITDPNTPFRLMNTKKLKPILKKMPSDFFLSNIIISMFVVKRKEKYLWLPISFKPRQGGTNSIDLKKIIKIGWKAIGDFYKIKRKVKKK